MRLAYTGANFNSLLTGEVRENMLTWLTYIGDAQMALTRYKAAAESFDAAADIAGPADSMRRALFKKASIADALFARELARGDRKSGYSHCERIQRQRSPLTTYTSSIIAEGLAHARAIGEALKTCSTGLALPAPSPGGDAAGKAEWESGRARLEELQKQLTDELERLVTDAEQRITDADKRIIGAGAHPMDWLVSSRLHDQMGSNVRAALGLPVSDNPYWIRNPAVMPVLHVDAQAMNQVVIRAELREIARGQTECDARLVYEQFMARRRPPMPEPRFDKFDRYPIRAKGAIGHDEMNVNTLSKSQWQERVGLSRQALPDSVGGGAQPPAVMSK